MTIVRGYGRKSFAAFLDDNPQMQPIDHSQIELWDKCHRKFDYIINHKLTDTVGGPALFSKHLIHPSLAGWYKSAGKHILSYTEKCDLWSNFTASPDSIPYGPYDRNAYSQKVFELAYNTYIEAYQRDHSIYNFVSSEEVYWSTIPGVDQYVWFSIPDLVLQQKVDNKLINVDFKFSKWSIGNSLSLYDRQFLGQAYATNSAAMMKIHMQPTYEDGKKAPSNVHIVRTRHPIDAELMQEWLAELKHTISEMQLAKKTKIYTKRSPHSCYEFNSTCAFLDVCNLGSMRYIEMKNYEKRDPMTYVWEDR